MIFSELYSAYYNTVADVLKRAVEKPLQKNELREIVEKHAFGESVLNIEPAITKQKWQLVRANGSTPLKARPTMPLTTLEKRWLKAIFEDKRIRLFCDETIDLPDVQPLFSPEDICVFDKYSDGDPYDDEGYIKNFRLILDAIKKQYALSIDTLNRRGDTVHMTVMPDRLEYSEKDDKFRLISFGGKSRSGKTVNLGRIVGCRPYKKPLEIIPGKSNRPARKTVELELVDKRSALERVMLHFAHFEKQAERLENDRYKIKITYDRDDETEMVIRILSFGPMVRVTAPQRFAELIKERLTAQKDCGIDEVPG